MTPNPSLRRNKKQSPYLLLTVNFYLTSTTRTRYLTGNNIVFTVNINNIIPTRFEGYTSFTDLILLPFTDSKLQAKWSAKHSQSEMVTSQLLNDHHNHDRQKLDKIFGHYSTCRNK